MISNMKERFFYCIFDGFSLYLDCFIEMFSIFSKMVEDEDRIFNVDFSFLFQLLHSGDDFSSISSDLKLFVLADVKQDTEL